MATNGRKTHSPFNFLGGMIVYAMLIAVVVFAGGRYLWGVLEEYQVKVDIQQAEYEVSRPDNYIKKYVQSFDEEHIRSVSRGFISGLSKDLQTEDECFEHVQALFNGEIAYNKTFSSEDRVTYDISCNNILLGNVEFIFDGTIWVVKSESFSFDWMLTSNKVTVPNDYTVSCNGYELDDSYIIESDIKFDILEEFEDLELFELPYFVTYEVSGYVGEASFDVADGSGNSFSVPEGSEQDAFIDNCSEEQIEFLDEYIARYIPLYIKYTSNADQNRYGNLEVLLTYILKGTSLEARMRGALDGLYYAHSRSDTLKELNFNHHMVLAEGVYFVDITYLVDTVGNAGLVTTTNNVKLIIVKNDHGTFTAAQSSY